MTEQTPNLGLPYIMAAQAQKHVTHNEAIRDLDTFVQLSVMSMDATTPDPSPQDGDRHIIGSAGADLFAGKQNHIASYRDEMWRIYDPRRGWTALHMGDNTLYAFDGSQWVAVSSDGMQSAQLGINTVADATNRLAVKSDAVLFSHDDATPGNGDVRHVLNKAAASGTASMVLQSGFSGRAELGLTGSDDLAIKVSADGAVWTDALVVDAQTGEVSMPQTTADNGLPAGGTSGQVLTKLSGGLDDVAWSTLPATTAVDAGTRHLYERELGQLPHRPAQPQLTTGTVSQNDEGALTANVGATCTFDIPLEGDEATADDVFVELRLIDRAPTTATVQEIAGSTLVSGTQLALESERDRLVLRNLAPQPGTTALRIHLSNDGGSAATTFTSPGIGRGEPATPLHNPQLAALDSLASDHANGILNTCRIEEVTLHSGPQPQVRDAQIALDGECHVTLTMPLGDPQTAPGDDPVPDQHLLVFHLDRPLADVSAIVRHGPETASTTTTVDRPLRHFGNNWYSLVIPASVGGEPTTAMELTLDNRATALVSTGQTTLSRLWLGLDAIHPPANISLPGVVHNALVDGGATTLHVDTDGDDNASGKRTAPLASLEEALRRGAGTILLRRNGIHRCGPLQLKRSLKLASYGQSEDESCNARIHFSILLGGNDLVDLGNGAHHFPTSTNPGGLWEVENETTMRLGVEPANGQGLRTMATDEAEVVANPGSWWFGTGSQGEGVYLQPFDSTLTGKQFEMPVTQTGLVVDPAPKLRMEGVSLAFAGETLISGHDTIVTATHCEFAHTGSGPAILCSGQVIWQDKHCSIMDAGGHGFSGTGPGRLLSTGTSFDGNGASGQNFEGDDWEIACHQCTFTGNAMDGHAHDGSGIAHLNDCSARSNARYGFSVQPMGPGPQCAVTLHNCEADNARLVSNQPDRLVVRLTSHRGPLELAAMATLEGISMSGHNDGHGLQVLSGMVDVTDAKISNFSTGVDFEGGALHMSASHVLRNTVGVKQTGGSLVIDTNAPINVHGNGTDFVGVDATQQNVALDFEAI